MSESIAESDKTTSTKGPVSKQKNAQSYLENNKVPQIFKSLIAGLMLEKPENHLSYLDAKLEEIQALGVDQVDWESFVYHMHPTRQPVHEQLIDDETTKKARALKSLDNQRSPQDYSPQVFQLTEAQD